jgi:putative ABC transport system substrate-binding protein
LDRGGARAMRAWAFAGCGHAALAAIGRAAIDGSGSLTVQIAVGSANVKCRDRGCDGDEFIAGLSVATSLGVWPLATFAQGPPKSLGFLGAADATSYTQWIAAFVRRLRELGWIEGRTVAIEYRWAEGSSKRATEFLDEFVRLKVDVIVTTGAALLASGHATSPIPVVLATSNDPIGSGLISSLARPGGNITGLSNQQSDLASKRLELLRQVIPNFRRLAVLANADNSASMIEMREVETTARTVGLEAIPAEVRRAEEISPALEMLKGRVEALYICSDFFIFTHRAHINSLALSLQLPTIYSESENVEMGALMSYGPSFSDMFRRAADFVNKILRGAKPADLPVEQPMKFYLAINVGTAKALGLTVPETLLATADDVIQ